MGVHYPGQRKEYTEKDFKASVGKYGRNGRPCYNTIADQEMVRYLLNIIPAWYGGAHGELWWPPQWGRTYDDLQDAIERFQKVHAIDERLFTDGHIDPHDRTIRALLKYAYGTAYQTPFDYGQPPPPPTPKARNDWQIIVGEEYNDTAVHLDNGVRIPLPARGRGGWPKERTLITVTRSVDKDGKISYWVTLEETRLPVGATLQEIKDLAGDEGSKELAGQAAKGVMRHVLPEAVPGIVGEALEGVGQLLIPGNSGQHGVDKAPFDFTTDEGSVTAKVHVVVGF
jgi:hypothetical protein